MEQQPLMERNRYNVISFQTDIYTDNAKLTVDPAPDTLIRVFMAWQAADEYAVLEEEALKATICRAISGVLEKRENGYELVRSHLIYAKSGDTKAEDLYIIDQAIKDEEVRIDELTELALGSENNQDKYMEAIADCNKRIAVLRENKDAVTDQLRYNTAAQKDLDLVIYIKGGIEIVEHYDPKIKSA